MQSYNPKTEMQKQLDADCFISSLGNVYSPIAEEIRDKDRIGYVAGGIRYVPFLEGGDATLRFFSKMRQLSPTHGGCIESIGKYCFGGDVRIVRQNDGFANTQADEQEVSEAEFNTYIEFLRRWTTGNDLVKAEKFLYQSWKTWGNAGIEVVRYRVAGIPYFKMYLHAGDTFRYMLTEDFEPNRVFISPDWSPYYLSKYPPTTLPTYPEFWEMADGTERSFIHVKNEVVERQWYGMPDSTHGLYYAYTEFQQGIYNTRGYDQSFTPSVFMQTFGDTTDVEGKIKLDEAFDSSFTNLGKAKKLIHRLVDIDVPTPFIHEFRDNSSHEFHEATAAIAEAQIIKAHDWHPVLFMKTPGAMGGSQEFMEIFEVKNISVIKPIQNAILSPLRTVCDIAAEWLGFDQNRLTIGAVSPFEMLVQQYKQSANNAANNAANNPSAIAQEFAANPSPNQTR
jgi:hypothetical protein